MLFFFVNMKLDKPKYIAVLIIFLIIFIGMEIFALNIDSHYKYDIPMCAILLIFMYWIREYIYLHWGHYFLFAVFLLVHCLGLFKFYELYPFGIEYDYWVHNLFGFISALIFVRWLDRASLGFNKMMRIGSVLIIVLGISAAHELYEFAGAVLLGKGEGVLFIGAGDLDQWDTQKDMLNNVVGGIIGILVANSAKYFKLF